MQLVEEGKEIKLSDKLMPKELRKPKVYKLVGMGHVDYTRIDDLTGRPMNVVNPYVVIEGTEIIHDKFEKDPTKRNKILECISGSRVVTREGKSFIEKEIENIEFTRGIVIVKPEEYYRYLFLERSNNNIKNPFRNPNKPGVWEPVEDEKEAAQLLADAEMKDDAVLLSKTMSFEDARAYAQRLEIPIDNRSSDQIRWDLRLKAESNPKAFIFGSKDSKSKRKIQISDAKAYGIIKFDADTNNWVWDFEKNSDNRIIVAVPVGTESPEKTLDEFFTGSGKKAYQKMVDALKNPEDFI